MEVPSSFLHPSLCRISFTERLKSLMSVWVLIWYTVKGFRCGGGGHFPSAIANKSESGSHCDGHPPSTGLRPFGGLIGRVWSFPRSSSPTPRVLQRVPRVSPGCEEPDLEDGSFSSTLGRLLCVACCALVTRAVPLSQLLVDTPVPVDNVCRPRVGSWTLGLLLWQVASVHRVARPEVL